MGILFDIANPLERSFDVVAGDQARLEGDYRNLLIIGQIDATYGEPVGILLGQFWRPLQLVGAQEGG